MSTSGQYEPIGSVRMAGWNWNCRWRQNLWVYSSQVFCCPVVGDALSAVLAAYSVYVQKRLFVERHSWNPVHGPRELQSSDGLALRCWLATHASRRLRWTCRSVAPSTSFRVLVADVLILDGCPLVFMGLLKGAFVRVAPLTGHT